MGSTTLASGSSRHLFSYKKKESTILKRFKSILLPEQFTLSILHHKQNLGSIYSPEQLMQNTPYCDLSFLFLNIQVEFETQILHDDR